MREKKKRNGQRAVSGCPTIPLELKIGSIFSLVQFKVVSASSGKTHMRSTPSLRSFPEVNEEESKLGQSRATQSADYVILNASMQNFSILPCLLEIGLALAGFLTCTDTMMPHTVPVT